MIRPMLASLTDVPLDDPQFVYEPKYDGIRAIAEVEGRVSIRGDTRHRVRLWSRLGNEKTHQFPEVSRALDRWARRLKSPLVLDGEIVALDAKGEPTGFQQLQRRIHLTDAEAGGPSAGRVAFIAFDVLREGHADLRDRPLLERRAALERLFSRTGSPLLRLSEMVRGDGRALYKRAIAHGWEGLIAKRADSKYRSGRRTPDWRKLKIVHEQEFVIGGWTEPRHARAYFGALLLGVYDTGRSVLNARKPSARGLSERESASELIYVGHAGTGFDERELARVTQLLRPLETKECPFRQRPLTNEKPHWARPELVAQIKFTEWTADGKLRHPVYLGLRDDKKPEEVVRDRETRLHATARVRLKPVVTTTVRLEADTTHRKSGRLDVVSGFRPSLLDQLRTIEDTREDGVLVLPDGDRLRVGKLHKVFWPKQKLTKGDLFRYYVQVAPYILPAVADRPLVMKRYPNGIEGQPFYQHRAPDVPGGVRVETVVSAERRPQIVGGNLKTLLYMTQLAAISQDPWFSRVSSPEFADHVALDLDPSSGVKFDRVLDVARWIRDELGALGTAGVPKTSGADGLHIYIPLRPGMPYDAGLLFCRIIATLVAQKHPKVATIERAVSRRGARVYIDYLQNVLGKTLATAYSARASAYAGASTPLTWQEIDGGFRREDFTIETLPARIKKVGDLWATLRESEGVDLSRVARYAERIGKG